MRATWLSVILCCSCMSMANQGLGTLGMSETNVNRMIDLSIGMCQQEVLAIMRWPYSYKVFMIDDDIYDVWFYVTKPTVLGQSRMVHQNLTPLSFKNGVLLGWGYPYYDHIVDLYNKPSMPAPLPAVPSPIMDSQEAEPQMEPANPPPATHIWWWNAQSSSENSQIEQDVSFCFGNLEILSEEDDTEAVKKGKSSSSSEKPPPPDEEGRDTLYDDAQDDFDMW